MTDTGQIPVSANNPCPFLRALVANGYVGGHAVPLPKIAGTIGLASGETGLQVLARALPAYDAQLVSGLPVSAYAARLSQFNNDGAFAYAHYDELGDRWYVGQ